MNKENAQSLRLENENNKLLCQGFVQIHFAPAPGTVKEKDFEKLYVVRKDGEDIFLKLESFVRVPFSHIGSIATIPATGLDSFTWAKQWMEKYPKTNMDTEMAVYCYQRAQ